MLGHENSLYPSRSELIRVAVREFLVRELAFTQGFSQFDEVPPPSPDPDPTAILIPDGKDEYGKTKFKRFKLVAK